MSRVTVTATGVCLLQSQPQVCARRGCVTMTGGVDESRDCVCDVFMCVQGCALQMCRGTHVSDLCHTHANETDMSHPHVCHESLTCECVHVSDLCHAHAIKTDMTHPHVCQESPTCVP